MQTDTPNPDDAAEDIHDEDTSVNAAHFELPEELSLDDIQNFIEDMATAIGNHDEIHINLEHLSVVTTPFVQACISLNRHAFDHEKKIKWTKPSEKFSEAFNNLGLYSEMMKMEFVA